MEESYYAEIVRKILDAAYTQFIKTNHYTASVELKVPEENFCCLAKILKIPMQGCEGPSFEIYDCKKKTLLGSVFHEHRPEEHKVRLAFLAEESSFKKYLKTKSFNDLMQRADFLIREYSPTNYYIKNPKLHNKK